jgi:hypothetical protein
MMNIGAGVTTVISNMEMNIGAPNNDHCDI